MAHKHEIHSIEEQFVFSSELKSKLRLGIVLGIIMVALGAFYCIITGALASGKVQVMAQKVATMQVTRHMVMGKDTMVPLCFQES